MSKRTSGLGQRRRRLLMVGLAMELVVGSFMLPAWAQAPPITPPDKTVCDGVNACDAPKSFCDTEGFKVTLKSFTPASQAQDGKATYVYEICEPAAGVCTGALHFGESCLDNHFCQTKGQDTDPTATCSRECAVNDFHGLSHFDVDFPVLADTSCLSSQNEVTGSCLAIDNSPLDGHIAAVGSFTTSDGSCDPNYCNITSTGTCGPGKVCSNNHAQSCNNNNDCGTGNTCGKICSNTSASCVNAADCNVGTCNITADSCTQDANCSGSSVAKCDGTDLKAGDCIQMTLQIAGETSDLGAGPIVLVTKDATTCQATCGAGPSCNACQEESNGSACLTRTLGFWGTHPWITNNYIPVTVCGHSLTCDGAADGKSIPACNALSCNSVMEGLGSTPGLEFQQNPPYVVLIKQLTAAKLNLAATAVLSPGATCSSWTYQGKTIQQWIQYCEEGDGTNTFGYCGANKTAISNSGCIEALDAFNNSQDNGFAQTPAPFDRPSVDDYGNVSGADPSQFNLAGGQSSPPGKKNDSNYYVIGKNVSGHNCP